MRTIFLLCLFLPGFSTTYGQAGKAPVTKGQVFNFETGLPVDLASISLYPTEQVTVTDERGWFIFKHSSQVIDSLSISSIGFVSKTISYNSFIKNNQKITLEPRIPQLSEITVSPNAGDQYKTISRLDIRMRNLNNSQDVLRLVPGLFIGQHAGGGKAEQIFLRGFDLDHGTDINISVDGMPVNMVSHAHGQGYADLHFLVPELIDHVNFKKGPYDADKGNLATAGHVEFKTKDVLTQNQVRLEAGQYNTWRALGMMNILGEKARAKNQSAFISTEYMFTKGYFDHPQDFNRLNIFGKYHGKINRRSTLTLTGSTFTSRWKASGQIPERAFKDGLISFFGAIDPNEGGKTSRTNGNAQLITEFNNGSYLKSQLYYTKYDFELFSNFTFFSRDSVNGDQIRQKESRHLAGYNGSYSSQWYAGNLKVSSEAGLQVRMDKTGGSELSATRDRIVTLESFMLGDIREINTGAYVDQAIRFNDHFSMNAGLRYDHFNMRYTDRLNSDSISQKNTGIFSPKLNFYYHINDKTELYITTGRGFHSNDTRVSVRDLDRRPLPAATGADLGANFKLLPNLWMNAAFWYLSLQQEFVYVGDEGVVEPSGRSRRLGLDLSARYQLFKNLFVDLDANYCYGRSTDEAKGKDFLPLAPVFTSIGGLTYKSATGLNGSLRYRFMSDRPANETNSVTAKGYFVTDALVNYTKPKYEFRVAVQNLFNVRWKETQFDTESRLKGELQPVSEIHFTPGTPFFLKASVAYFF
jgi:hypothetical protein